LVNFNSSLNETLNSLIARYTGAKRQNFAMSFSYHARCAAAVLQFNTGRCFSTFYEFLIGSEANEIVQNVENEIIKKNENRKSNPNRKPKNVVTTDQHYGPNIVQEPSCSSTLTPFEFGVAKTKILEVLQQNQGERLIIYEDTMGQSNNNKWFDYRKNLLTASNFGEISKKIKASKKPQCSNKRKDFDNVTKRLVYGTTTNINHPACIYGLKNEINARKCLSDLKKIEIRECGLMIDDEISYLGCSSDGTIGEDGLVEIKCPASCSTITIKEAIVKKNAVTNYLNYSMDTETSEVTIHGLKKTHNYYYQVQGQLHIMKRQYCFFMVWTNKDYFIEKIFKDDDFWETEMKIYLMDYYENYFIKELVEPKMQPNAIGGNIP
jgi:hypothetical protein